MKTMTVLLNWNGYEDTINCIYSLLETGIELVDIIVVDNASENESIPIMIEKFPELTVIKNHKNGGFAAGCNLGIVSALNAGADSIWILNNDTTINSSALTSMQKVFDNPKIGIVGSMVVNSSYPFALQAWGGGGVNFFLGTSKHINEKTNMSQKYYITGASMLIRSAVFKEVGLFDEDFFMYWEDVEFSIRAQDFGWLLGVAEDSIVFHKESNSIKKYSTFQAYYYNRSARIFFKKRRGPVLCICPIVIGQMGRSIKIILRGQIALVSFIWK